MHVDSPVKVEVVQPELYDRAEVLLRLIIVTALGLVGLKYWPLGLLYLALPVVATVLRSLHSPGRYRDDDAPRLVRFLTWVAGVLAYFTLVTDRLPGTREPTVGIKVTLGRPPTVFSALARLVLGLPSVFVLALLDCASAIASIVGSFFILAEQRCPHGLWTLQLAVLRWHMRLYAYQASLVDAYPPFTMDTAPGTTHVDTGGLIAA